MLNNKNIFFLASLLVFIFIFLKATVQGISHDEAATFFHYIHAEVFIPGEALWDANNHIINSFLSIQFYKIFGKDLIFLRLTNVLSFLLYAFYIYKTSSFLNSKWSKYAYQLALLTPIFLLDFFTLTRGYAMSIAFLWAAIFHFAAFFTSKSLKDNILFWIFIALATWSNLSLINNYLIFIGIFVGYSFFNYKDLTISSKLLFFFPGLTFFTAAGLYSYKMKLLGLLYYGNQDGFVATTLSSLANFQFDKDNFLVASIWFFSMLLFGILVFVNAKSKTQAIAFFSFKYMIGTLLLLNVLGVFLLNILLGVNFPEDRAAIYFIPLFIAAFVVAVDELLSFNSAFKWLYVFIFIFPIQLIANTSMQGTKLWKTLYMYKEMHEVVVNEQKKSNKLLSINGYRLHKMSWAYFNLNKSLNSMYAFPYPDTCADIIFAVDKDYDMDNFKSYSPFYHSNFSDMTVWKRNVFLERHNFFHSKDTLEYRGSDTFYEIFNDTLFSDYKRVSSTFDIVLDTKERPFIGSVVFEVKDMKGKLINYEAIPFDWLRSEWEGDMIKIQRNLPDVATNKTHLKIYIWNFKEKNYQTKVSNLTFSYIF